jgi:uncharacterized repeat protein (TIGR01451 family)
MKTKFAIILLFLTVIGNAQIINFPDANFKGMLLVANSTNIQMASTQALNANGYVSTYNKIDTNNDGEISIAEASVITWLSISGGLITDLTGIEYFTNLQYLDCNTNNLTSLNLSAVLNLKYLSCNSNNIASLNISGLLDLYKINCSFNQLTSLDLSGLTNIRILYCFFNQFTSLNLSGLTNLTNLRCNNNPLTTLYIKNGSIESTLDFSDNTNLEYICADEGQVESIQALIAGYAYTNCHANSYCSFSPGGTFYTIQGNNRYDSNSNGCDVLDINFTSLTMAITDGTNMGTIIPNATGSYQYDIQAGTQILTPQLENPTYFTVSPATATVTFPSATSSFTQDFCITANGVHHDLEVVVIPINVARPGFDTTYKIRYKNKGVVSENATVTFNYNDAILDYVSSSLSLTSQVTGTLSWNVGTLAPFQSGEVLVTLNVNFPTETPAVIAGDILSYVATITGLNTDETTADNTSAIVQTVVNSFDPNDKTCLEGNTITPAQVGDYVHYVIRFENTGTFPAQNIVVKDLIDTTKFDIATIVPLSSSHDFVTKINGDKVEFIFENINLPFAAGTNGGYVAFKIKTKSTLVLGTSFSNLATIYFDYNFPIVTNTYTTTVQNSLGTSPFIIDKLTIFPNPIKDVLQFKTIEKVVKIEVYDIAGRILSSISVNENKVDLTALRAGNYILKVYTENGISNTQILKE